MHKLQFGPTLDRSKDIKADVIADAADTEMLDKVPSIYLETTSTAFSLTYNRFIWIN